MRNIIVFVFAPTRIIIELIIEQVKRAGRDYGKCIRQENWIFRCIFIVSTAWFYLPLIGLSSWHLTPWLRYIGLWAVPFSRINELAIAFYRDAVQQLTEIGKEGPSHVERLRFLLSAYVEVAIQFGILYFCLPWLCFSKSFSSIIEAIYFSVVTITTAGYGDIAPKGDLSQLACMYELGVGFVLIIFTLGSYLATRGTPPQIKASANKAEL